MGRDPDTEIIRKTVDEIQSRQTRTPSGVHRVDECDKEPRITKLEGRMDTVESRLSQGDLGFLELRKDMAVLAEKVGTLTRVIAAVGIAMGLGLLGTAGAALVWVIQKMGSP